MGKCHPDCIFEVCEKKRARKQERNYAEWWMIGSDKNGREIKLKIEAERGSVYLLPRVNKLSQKKLNEQETANDV